MSFIVNDDGRLELGPPDDPNDPVRRQHREILGALAWKFELDTAVLDALGDAELQQRKQIAALESRVAFLEQMLLAATAVQR